MTEALLRDRDLMAILNVSRSTFYAAKANGMYRQLEVTPQLTRTTRYSPENVQAWKEGRPGFYAGSFGRRRAG